MVVKDVTLMAQNKSIKIDQYLDDWLVRAISHQTCLQHTQILLALCQELGWVLNMEKSELEAKQSFDFECYQFEIIILSFKSDCNSFVAACVYRPPGSCTTQFLEDFLALSSFLSSTGSSFIICGDINVHLDIECGDRSRFNDILQCCGLVQSVSGPTHLLGHTLDVLISPCDSDFVRNVSVGDFFLIMLP